MSARRRLFATTAPRSVVLVRALVGIVFVSEGIQKFLTPAALGAGRFAKIGIPAPEVMGPFIGGLELACGVLVLAGLLTRAAALLLVADMVVAIVSTKIPILLGHGYWRFAGPSVKPGFWSLLHEARTDLSMLLGAAFLGVVGAGPWSLDARIARRQAE
jgi:putative oxidoreductase